MTRLIEGIAQMIVSHSYHFIIMLMFEINTRFGIVSQRVHPCDGAKAVINENDVRIFGWF